MISSAIFDAVRAGRMTPERGAEWLMAAHDAGRVGAPVCLLAVAIGALFGVC